ncbi:MAG TPA: hypothetical protein DCE42_21720 [Myxococcales bacterium]|nr:hypothetical protein [Deltaproteobacteria bacterium]MBU48087.1 hypothetical protein [Deltaproteobacteria bacterium]HAA57399.1 hypothetical protein [Myxococcales bacterium]|tara:strand:+ start:8425 stop:9855 length:1431 start_codon:yes stop_codon:yes gene_type:complete
MLMMLTEHVNDMLRSKRAKVIRKGCIMGSETLESRLQKQRQIRFLHITRLLMVLLCCTFTLRAGLFLWQHKTSDGVLCLIQLFFFAFLWWSRGYAKRDLLHEVIGWWCGSVLFFFSMIVTFFEGRGGPLTLPLSFFMMMVFFSLITAILEKSERASLWGRVAALTYFIWTFVFMFFGRGVSVVPALKILLLVVPSLMLGGVTYLISLVTQPFHTLLAESEEAKKQLLESNEELRKARIEAERSNETKSLFLASMSHELRTPLNAILGYAEMVEEELQDEGMDELCEDVKKINKASHHLVGVISELLDLSRIESGQMELREEVFVLGHVMQEVSSIAAPLAKKNNNQFHVDVEGEQCELIGDPLRVRQCLINLLSNAFKFTEKGDVFFRVVPGSCLGLKGISFEIRDTGMGMNEEQLTHIFDPYWRAVEVQKHSFVQGTGLGLAITQRLWLMMGGELHVESQPGEGTTFTLCLPLHM